MSIVRTSKRSNFVSIDQRALSDLSLSWEAKGLHAYLLSRPDNWEVRVAQLVKYGHAKRDKIYRMLRELVEQGYAERRTVRGESGRMAGCEFIVHESKTVPSSDSLEITDSPLPEKPYPVKPDPVLPDTAKTTLTNIDNKQILIVASSEQPLENRWTPSGDVFQVLKNHGVDRSFIESLIPEFIIYWREHNPHAGSWNSKFTSQVLRQWAAQSPFKTIAETPAATLQRFFDRSWAKGLVDHEVVVQGCVSESEADE
jgi:hypothetical protein